MKIKEAQSIYRAERANYNEQLNALMKQRDKAQQQFRITGDQVYADEAATLELSLNEVKGKQAKNQEILDSLAEQHMLAFNAENSKAEADAAAEWGKEMGRIMTTVARMCAGDKVPPKDEKKVQEYDSDLYMKAKHAQMMMATMKEKRKEHDSLWEDEEERKEYDPMGVADNTEAAVPLQDVSLEGGAEVSTSANMRKSGREPEFLRF